ncbi:hypothetical protein NQ317_016393 [Molorchus minor]|uniref:BHLH domain-containing protein n=1 Tax=Molorchus minor TaxID=1323400 RepID=A0ABQ9JKN4_9CUCU|nr:hypothetical protein NQ317_016393 [Molorchus minor]
MKAIVSAMCSENGVAAASGRVSRKKDIENEEIQMYLSKLKDLVPFMPKNKKLSKLEVIQYVIDYICDLQSALETHPAVNAFDAAAALSQKKSQAAVSPRQPLGVRPSPNTILTPCEAPVLQNVMLHRDLFTRSFNPVIDGFNRALFKNFFVSGASGARAKISNE